MAFLKSILLQVATIVVDKLLKYIRLESQKNEIELAKGELDEAKTNEEIKEAVDNDDSYPSA